MNTSEEIDILPIVHDVRYAFADTEITNGVVNIIVPDSGAGLVLCEPLPEFLEQFKAALELFPGEGIEAVNKSKEVVDIKPRIKSAMLGRTLSLPLIDGDLPLKLREEIMLVDFETKSLRREYLVQVMGEGEEGKEDEAQEQYMQG